MPVERLAGAPLNRTDARLIANMAAAYPGALSDVEVLQGVFVDGSSLKVILCRLRKRIAPYGWTIPSNRSGRGYRGAYRLAPKEL